MMKIDKHGVDCCDLCNVFNSAYTKNDCKDCKCHKEALVNSEAFKFTYVMLVVCVMVLLWLFITSPARAEAATLQSNEGSSIDMENFGTSASKGQSFEHDTDFDIESIEFWGGLGNSPASTVDIEIYDGEAYGGSVLCTETAFDVSGLPNYSSPAWNVLDITCAGLTANTRYTIKVTPTDGSSSDGLRWATSDTTYPVGIEYYGTSGRSGRDTMFRVNGTEVGGGGGSSTPTTTEATSTTLAINGLNVTLLTFFGLLAFLIGAIIPLWIWRYFTR